MSERIPSIIVISGPSGAGKSTIVSRVLSGLGGVRFSVSHTTRAPRPGEAHGKQYHFVPRAEFDALVVEDRFLEWAEVHGNRYGTCMTEYESAMQDGLDLLLDVDVQGAQKVVRRFPDAVSVFVLPPSFGVLERRLRTRGPEDEVSLRTRLTNAQREMQHFDEYQYAIINHDIEESVRALEAVVRAARSRTSRVDTAARAVLETFEHLPG
jgi:guanylate kinase